MAGNVDFTIEDLISDSHRSLYAWFTTFSERDTLPSRADFEPLDFPTSLQHLVLVDVEQDPVRYRARLVGTAITEARGLDATGDYYDETTGTEEAIARRCGRQKRQAQLLYHPANDLVTERLQTL